MLFICNYNCYNGIDNGGIIFIQMGLVTYYIGLVNILEDIGNGNVRWFCNYNRNHHSGSRSIGIWIRIGNIIEFCFWYLFGNI